MVDVPADDVYTISLVSDDGSDLRIDDQLVIDNDGLHGSSEKRANIALGKGRHVIDVRWFNKTGAADLSLRWAPLGGTLGPMGPFTRHLRDYSH
jgi:hypothetical protein